MRGIWCRLVWCHLSVASEFDLWVAPGTRALFVPEMFLPPLVPFRFAEVAAQSVFNPALVQTTAVGNPVRIAQISLYRTLSTSLPARPGPPRTRVRSIFLLARMWQPDIAPRCSRQQRLPVPTSTVLSCLCFTTTDKRPTAPYPRPLLPLSLSHPARLVPGHPRLPRALFVLRGPHLRVA